MATLIVVIGVLYFLEYLSSSWIMINSCESPSIFKVLNVLAYSISATGVCACFVFGLDALGSYHFILMLVISSISLLLWGYKIDTYETNKGKIVMLISFIRILFGVILIMGILP